MPGERVRLLGPDGGTYSVEDYELDDALQQGYTRIDDTPGPVAAASLGPGAAPTRASSSLTPPAQPPMQDTESKDFNFTDFFFGEGSAKKMMGVSDTGRQDYEMANLRAAAEGKENPYSGMDIFLAGAGEDTDPAALAAAAAPMSLLGKIPLIGKGLAALANKAPVRAALHGVGAYGAAQGAENIEGAVSGGLDTPKEIQGALEGGAGLTGGVGAAVGVKNLFRRAVKPGVKEAAQVAATGLPNQGDKAREFPAQLKRSWPLIEKAATKLGFKRSDFAGKGGFQKYVDTVDTAVADLEAVYAPVLAQHGKIKLSGNSIAKDILDLGRGNGPFAGPDFDAERKALVKIAQKYRGKWFTLEQLNNSRRSKNTDLTGFFNKNQMGQYHELDQVKTAAADAARGRITELLYGELQRRSGLDLSQIKAMESELITVREQAKSRLKPTMEAEARYEALGPVGRAREHIGSALAFSSSRPAVSKAVGLDTPAAIDTRRLLGKAFSPTKSRVPTGQLARAAQVSTAAEMADPNSLPPDEIAGAIDAGSAGQYVRVLRPDGKTSILPVDQLEAAKSRGYKVLQQ